jgi:uncharacterized protein (DUF305 family)
MALQEAAHPAIRHAASDLITERRSELSAVAVIASTLRRRGVRLGELGLPMSERGMTTGGSMIGNTKPYDLLLIDALVPHEEGALRIARAELQGGGDPRLEAIARGIRRSRAREISALRAWRRLIEAGPASG